MRPTKHIIIIVLFLSQYSLAQIEINKPIVFVSSESNDRFVRDIRTTTNIDLLGANEVILNTYQYAATKLQNDTLFADFSFNYTQLNIGLKLYIKLPQNITSNINYLQIDDLAAKRIYLNINEDMLITNVSSDETLMTLYDGNSFQILKSKKYQTCQTGFVEVSGTYCVSEFRQGPGNFQENSMHCNSLNARLCSWAEWYYACETNTTIIDMIFTGREWVDSGGTGDSNAKVAGNNSCKPHTYFSSVDGSAYFRCCYSLK